MDKTNKTDKTDKMSNIEENKTKMPPLLIKDRKPQLITLKAVDWNAARLLQRIQNGGDRMFE